MSNLDTRPLPTACGGRQDISAAPVRDLLTGRVVPLGESTEVRRLLPNLGRRMVGAWCFVDHYGPDDIAGASRACRCRRTRTSACRRSAGCTRARCCTATAWAVCAPYGRANSA